MTVICWREAQFLSMGEVQASLSPHTYHTYSGFCAFFSFLPCSAHCLYLLPNLLFRKTPCLTCSVCLPRTLPLPLPHVHTPSGLGHGISPYVGAGSVQPSAPPHTASPTCIPPHLPFRASPHHAPLPSGCLPATYHSTHAAAPACLATFSATCLPRLYLHYSVSGRLLHCYPTTYTACLSCPPTTYLQAFYSWIPGFCLSCLTHTLVGFGQVGWFAGPKAWALPACTVGGAWRGLDRHPFDTVL